MKGWIANLAGGLPDLLMSRMPRFLLEKNRSSYGEYLDSLEFHAFDRWPPDTNPFLVVPRTPPAREEIETRRLPGGVVRQVLRYPSRYEARDPAVRARFLGHRANLTGYLHLWRHEPGASRPLVLCLHGFMMGRPSRAERMFRVEKLLGLGVDVGLFTHPHHWRRAGRASLRQRFLDPNDVPLTIENIAQGVHDLDSCVLLARSLGYERVGLIGASLGGFAGALYATTGPPVDFLFLVVPAMDFSDLLDPARGEFPFRVDERIVSGTRRALATVTPARYPPGFDVERISVVYHQGDRICPVRHTREWIRGWSIANRVELPGGHWLHLGAGVRGRTWYGWLERMGYIEPR